jgi:hypothetical protein
MRRRFEGLGRGHRFVSMVKYLNINDITNFIQVQNSTQIEGPKQKFVCPNDIFEQTFMGTVQTSEFDPLQS